MECKVRLIFGILALTLINAYFTSGRKSTTSTKDVCIALENEDFQKCYEVLSREWNGENQSDSKRTVQRAGERRE